MNNQNWLRTDNISETYHIISEVGAGTYGTVYKAQCLRDKTFVALKKFELFKENRQNKGKPKNQYHGFPITAIREIKILELVNHPNLIKLHEIISTKPSLSNNFKSSTFLVFEYMEHDFLGFLTQKIHFTIPQIKCIMHQILKGIAYLHQKNIVHRDIKAANILYNNQGEVKLADFGLARQIKQYSENNLTNKVVTLWYRAPELLFGATNYTTSIDVWSIGCIFGELLIDAILFKGDKEVRQLELIQKLCGKADKHVWPDIEKLPLYSQLSSNQETYKYKLREFIMQKRPELQQNGFDLLQKMLTLDPKKRITCEDALKHTYFQDQPAMCQVNELPKYNNELHDTLLKQQLVKQNFNQQKHQEMFSQSNRFRQNHHQMQQQSFSDLQTLEKNQSQLEPNKTGNYLQMPFFYNKLEQICDQQQVIQSSNQQNFLTSQYNYKKTHSQREQQNFDDKWIFDNILKKISKN